MWKKISTKLLLKHPRLIVEEDVVQLPNGKQICYLKYGAPHQSVMAICVQGDKVLVQQEYSYPPDKILYQFPGGKVENNESSLEAIKRELSEESDLIADHLKLIGSFYVDNRRNSNMIEVYVINKPKKDSRALMGDPEESITSKWLDVSTITQMIRDGEITNYSFLAGWSLFISLRD